MKLLIGTNNQNKLKQFKRIFGRLKADIELMTLSEAGITDEVEEDRDNLMDNAKKKAKYYGSISGLLTLADDTGLFVDALGGEPGVHAKRWHDGTDKERYMKILDRLKEVPAAERTARYTGVLAVYDPAKDAFWTYQNDTEGRIADAPREGNGFGYDPIVIIDRNGKYYSSLSDEERDAVSHRGPGIEVFWKSICSPGG